MQKRVFNFFQGLTGWIYYGIIPPMYLAERDQYLTETLTRNEYRKFNEYLVKSDFNIGHVVEKLDETFRVTLDRTPLTYWGEILEAIRTND